jgi:hypothetical protein
MERVLVFHRQWAKARHIENELAAVVRQVGRGGSFEWSRRFIYGEMVPVGQNLGNIEKKAQKEACQWMGQALI